MFSCFQSTEQAGLCALEARDKRFQGNYCVYVFVGLKSQTENRRDIKSPVLQTAPNLSQAVSVLK